MKRTNHVRTYKAITQEGRVKLTTAIKPELRDALRNIAKENRISLADVLNDAAEAYIKDYYEISA